MKNEIKKRGFVCVCIFWVEERKKATLSFWLKWVLRLMGCRDFVCQILADFYFILLLFSNFLWLIIFVNDEGLNNSHIILQLYWFFFLKINLL